MMYTLENGKKVNIPDKDIDNYVDKLEISQAEAIEMWLCDNDYETNEEQEELVKKSKGQRHYEKSDTPRKKTTRERKVDEEKKHLISCIKVLLEGLGANISNVKNEAEISFIFGKNDYTLKLIKHRPPKA